MNTLFLGADPGKTGAVAVIDEMRVIHFLRDYPGNEIELAKIIWEICDFADKEGIPLKAAIERQGARPNVINGKIVQTPTSFFQIGDNFGVWRMAMAMAGVPFETPTPQAWMKGVVIKKKNAKKKEANKEAALKLFPTSDIFGPRGGYKDGRGDALLIADWCRRQFFKDKT